jgi:predicted MFS family arabinose efflux permease
MAQGVLQHHENYDGTGYPSGLRRKNISLYGRIIAKTGNARLLLSIGTSIRILVTLFYLLFLGPDTPFFIVCIAQFCAGFYSAQQSVTFSTGPQIQIEPKVRMQANSLIQVSMSIGSTVGMAVFTLVMAALGVTAGMPVALLIALITAIIYLVVGQFLRKLPTEDETTDN